MGGTGTAQRQHRLLQSGSGRWRCSLERARRAAQAQRRPRHFPGTFNVLAGRAKQRKMRPGIEAQMTKARWRPKSP